MAANNLFYYAMGAPKVPANITRADLVDMVDHLAHAHRTAVRLFAHTEPIVIRVPSGAYLARISKHLNAPIRRRRITDNNAFLSVEYNGVEFNAYETDGGTL